MEEIIARKRLNTDFEDRLLFLLNSGNETVRLQVSNVAFVAPLLAVPLIALQLSASARVASNVRDASITEYLVKVSLALAYVARKVHDEEIFDSLLFFTTERSALNMSMKSSISEKFTYTRLLGEWKLAPSFYFAPLLYVDFPDL